MKPIRITIKTDNAAFDNLITHETARILRDLADRFDRADMRAPQDGDSIPLFDINGNRVGECRR